MRDPENEVGSHRQPILAVLTKQLRIRVLCGVLPGIPRLPAIHICKKTDKRMVKFPKELWCCIHSDAQYNVKMIGGKGVYTGAITTVRRSQT